MASGIPRTKWNNADVTAREVDLVAMSAWYEERDVPWGIRVPLDLSVELGTALFVKRCVALLPAKFPDQASPSGGLQVSPADANDPAAFAALDAAMFGGDIGGAVEESRAWVEPQFRAAGFRHWVAELDDVQVGIATTLRSDGEAGPAAYLTGLAVLAGSPRREVVSMLVAVAVADAFSAGAEFVHMNPDYDLEAGWLASFGAVEVPGLLVRVVRSE